MQQGDTAITVKVIDEDAPHEIYSLTLSRFAHSVKTLARCILGKAKRAFMFTDVPNDFYLGKVDIEKTSMGEFVKDMEMPNQDASFSSPAVPDEKRATDLVVSVTYNERYIKQFLSEKYEPRTHHEIKVVFS